MQFILRPVVLFALLLSAGPAFAEWRALGPDGGSVVSLAVDPVDPRVVYAGTRLSGRLYKTVDGGETWELSDQGLPVASSAQVNALAIDPLRRGTVWAGTNQHGIYKSTDAGASWSLSLPPRAGFNNAVLSLAVDPRTPDIVYVATSSGMFRTVNGGAAWELKDAGLPATVNTLSDVEVDPVQPGVVYAAAGLDGLYRSRDGGETWRPARQGLPAGDPVRILAAGPGVVYAATGPGRLFKSTDRGASWQPANSGLPADDAVIALAVHPRVPRIVYAGLYNVLTLTGQGIYRSENGGASWAPASTGLTHPEILELELGGAGVPLYAATEGEASPGGVFRSDDGRTWRRVVGGLSAARVLDVLAEPGDPDALWSSLGTLGLFRSADEGFSWAPVTLAPDLSFIREITRDPRSPGTLYVVAESRSGGASRFSLFRTTDSGGSWTRLALPAGAFSEVKIDPRNGALFLLGQPFSYSTDGGASWRQPASGIASEAVQDMAFPPSPASVIYAAGQTLPEGTFRITEARVFKSADGGATWTRSDTGLEGVFRILRIVTLPTAPSTLFATDGGSIFRSVDAATHWERVFGPTPPSSIQDLLAAPDGTLYALSSTRGVFTSRDGVGWTLVTPAPPAAASLTSLTLDPDDRGTFYAASNYGVQAFTLPRASVCVPSETALCLLGNRFRVEVVWRDFDGNEGTGKAVPQTSDTGVFWFFHRENLELMVKVIDGRANNGHFWVYYGALSNVAFTITVTDTATGLQKTYRNPSGRFASVGDIEAF